MVKSFFLKYVCKFRTFQASSLDAPDEAAQSGGLIGGLAPIQSPTKPAFTRLATHDVNDTLARSRDSDCLTRQPIQRSQQLLQIQRLGQICLKACLQPAFYLFGHGIG